MSWNYHADSPLIYGRSRETDSYRRVRQCYYFSFLSGCVYTSQRPGKHAGYWKGQTTAESWLNPGTSGYVPVSAHPRGQAILDVGTLYKAATNTGVMRWYSWPRTTESSTILWGAFLEAILRRVAFRRVRFVGKRFTVHRMQPVGGIWHRVINWRIQSRVFHGGMLQLHSGWKIELVSADFDGTSAALLGVRAEPVEWVYTLKEKFSENRYFFVFQSQYQSFGLYVSKISEGGFEITPGKDTHGICYPKISDYRKTLNFGPRTPLKRF